MENADGWDFTCRSSNDIPKGVARTFVPPGAIDNVSPELVSQMGGTVSELYPDFALTFPETAAAMEACYDPPVLLLTTIRLNWIHQFALKGSTNNIVFRGDVAGPEKTGEMFEKSHAMLPITWIELYRWFDSFAICTNLFPGFEGANTPVSYASRFDVKDMASEYEERGIKTPKKDLKKFEQEMDSQRLFCWMYTDSGDMLWIDEQRLNRKVYHNHVQRWTDVQELVDAGGTLDRYLAHVVSGSSPGDFDLRGG